MQQKQKIVGFQLLRGAIALIFLALLTSTTACFHTKGSMYLGKNSVGSYLDKNKEIIVPKGVDSKTYKEWHKNLGKIPDGNRILGGFCASNQKVRTILSAMDSMRPLCQHRLYQDTRGANLKGKLFWWFFAGSTGAGATTILTSAIALSASSKDTQTNWGVVSVVFGTFTLAGILVNSLANFSARHDRHKILANQIDNFMWTLRLRIISQVCNAKDDGTAVQQAVFIYKMTQRICTHPRSGDGNYRIPKDGVRFDTKNLPSAPPPSPPIQEEPNSKGEREMKEKPISYSEKKASSKPVR